MSERLSSGHPRLDAVLGGGLPANAITMLIGLPGTGLSYTGYEPYHRRGTQPAVARRPSWTPVILILAAVGLIILALMGKP